MSEPNSQKIFYASAGEGESIVLPAIGEVFSGQGGFYGGSISYNANGIATHALVVSNRADGNFTGLTYHNPRNNDQPGAASVIDGASNTTVLIAGGGSEIAATCSGINASGGISGFTDWYIPAKWELDVLYYNLKPTTEQNRTTQQGGNNPYSVSPQPTGLFTPTDPGITSATDFQQATGNNYFNPQRYWSSSQAGSITARYYAFDDSLNATQSKSSTARLRLIRKVAL